MAMEPAYIQSSLLNENGEMEKELARKTPMVSEPVPLRDPPGLSVDNADTDSTAGSDEANRDVVEIEAAAACMNHGIAPWDCWAPGMQDVHAMGAYGAFGPPLPYPGMGAFPPMGYMDGMTPMPPQFTAATMATLLAGCEAWNDPMGIGGEAGSWSWASPPCGEGDAAALAAGISIDLLDKSPPTAPPSHLPSADSESSTAVPTLDMPDSIRGSSASSEEPPLPDVRSCSAPESSPTSLLPPPPGLTRAKSTPLGHSADAEDICRGAWPAPPMLMRAVSSPARPYQAQPPSIVRTERSGICRISWTVDARKLKVKDKVAVSPSFVINFGVSGTFRMMLVPKAVSDRKGGASFKKAKGKGSVHVKCESPEGEVHDGTLALRIFVASYRERNSDDDDCFDTGHEIEQDDEGKQEAPRGPVLHNFAVSGMCSLPKDQEEWDFGKATDADSQNFVVHLEITDPSLVDRMS